MKKLQMKKNSFVALLFAFLVLLGACSNDSETKENSTENSKEKTAWDIVKEEGKITVATSGTLYPSSFHDSESDKLTGFEVEVVREMAKRLGLEADFVEMGFDGMLTSVNSGQVNIAANDISITDDRKEKFAFSTPYKYSFATAIVRKDDLSGIETVEDLKGKKAAGEATTVYMDIARKYGAEEVIYDNATNELYLRDVAAGRTDLIINDYYLQMQAIEYYPDLNITIHPDLKFGIPDDGVGIIMKKDEVELQENINKAIQEMLADGTISELSKQFFSGEDVTVKPDLQY
ncbi:transporter substrate-binding domain-containing protein [Caldibacillus lycopersici]|uniref:Transporter substrate-binding domain-containing protein n=1 Tax=Perspicuibacillus lycopersici TaxID=1325689 RepID=A0AAE3IQK5_9BACI|nr:transporter substrate-binding domain-containing protein [Perspicuibacillus lycopersici]MCU9612586.1 transporter substrate-binding domain-containing protein [Perspicuibacillus lycopersici]